MRWRANPLIVIFFILKLFLVELCPVLGHFSPNKQRYFEPFFVFGSRFRTLAVLLVSDFWLKGIQTGTLKRLDDTIMKTNWSYLRTKGDKMSLVLLRSKESYLIIIVTCRLNSLPPWPAAEFMICCSVLTGGEELWEQICPQVVASVQGLVGHNLTCSCV